MGHGTGRQWPVRRVCSHPDLFNMCCESSFRRSSHFKIKDGLDLIILRPLK